MITFLNFLSAAVNKYQSNRSNTWIVRSGCTICSDLQSCMHFGLLCYSVTVFRIDLCGWECTYSLYAGKRLLRAPESFQTSRWSVDRLMLLFWKTLLGQWNTAKGDMFIWLVGLSRCMPVPPAVLVVHDWRPLGRQNPITPLTLPLLVRSGLIVRIKSTLFTTVMVAVLLSATQGRAQQQAALPWVIVAKLMVIAKTGE